MIFKFDIDFFMLEGEEKEWEDGGKMIVFVVVLELILGLQMNGEFNKKS